MDEKQRAVFESKGKYLRESGWCSDGLPWLGSGELRHRYVCPDGRKFEDLDDAVRHQQRRDMLAGRFPQGRS